MKSLTVILLLSLVFNVKAKSRISVHVEKDVRELIKLWQQNKLQARLTFKIPPLDPLPLPPFCQRIEKVGVTADFESSPLSIRGLKNAVIKTVDVSDTGNDIAFEGSVPVMYIHADHYELKGMYKGRAVGTAGKGQDVTSNGKMDLTLFGVNVKGKIHIQPTASGAGTEVTQLAVIVTAEKAEDHLEHISRVIHSLINTKGKILIDSFNPEINKINKAVFDKFFKEPLSKIKFQDIVGFGDDIIQNKLKGGRRSGGVSNATINVLRSLNLLSTLYPNNVETAKDYKD